MKTNKTHARISGRGVHVVNRGTSSSRYGAKKVTIAATPGARAAMARIQNIGNAQEQRETLDYLKRVIDKD